MVEEILKQEDKDEEVVEIYLGNVIPQKKG